jgi:hypothetical protein
VLYAGLSGALTHRSGAEVVPRKERTNSSELVREVEMTEPGVGRSVGGSERREEVRREMEREREG